MEWHERCLITDARPWAIPPLGAVSVGGFFVFFHLRPIDAQRERSEKWNGSPSGNVSVKTEFGPKVARPTDWPSE
jgi:hypothetical protein